MIFSQTPKNRGLINLIILIIVAILILSYFGYNLRAIVNAPNTQDNFSYVGGGIADLWNNYLSGPATYLWNTFVNLIWNPAIQNITNMNSGKPTNIQQLPPMLSPTR